MEKRKISAPAYFSIVYFTKNLSEDLVLQLIYIALWGATVAQSAQ
jgi:hypothetical protein